ncbi:hypothetical protein N2152v2_000278 [Parachlorella kessleri]
MQQRHLGSEASCKQWVAATAAGVRGQPGNRQGKGAGPAGRSEPSLGSSTNSSGRDQDVVAAVLASAGLDPAELQRQAPTSYSQLSTALARVLAEVYAEWVAGGRVTRVPAAKLMTRICFLASEVGLTAAEIRAGHRKHVKFLSFSLDGARRLHGWLQLQHLSKDQLRLASRNNSSSPTLLLHPSGALLSRLDSVLAAESSLGVSIPWLLCNGGSFLSHSTESLLSKVKFLRDYGFDSKQLSKVLRGCLMALGSSVENKIKPTLAALQSVLGSQDSVVEAVVNNPSLLVSAVETLEGNVEVMQQLGMSSAEISKSVGKQPQLFGCDYQKQDFQDKLRYFEAVLDRSPRHMLVEQPAVLKSALKRVDYRLSFMEQKGDVHHKSTLSWVGCSDKQFCAKYQYSAAEFEGWREQWVCSERARQYGLDKAEEPGMARAQQARERRRKAGVAARREKVLAAGEE